MTDQSIDITTTHNYVRTLLDEDGQLEQLSRDANVEALQSNPGIMILGVVAGAAVLFWVFCLSRNYTTLEREELAEAERNRLAADVEEIRKKEIYRSKIAKIIDGYAIHLTNMTSSVLSPSSRHNASEVIAPAKSIGNNTKKQIPNGSDDYDIPIESITITSHSSGEDLEDVEEKGDIGDDDDDDELNSEDVCDTACDTLRSTLTIELADQKRDEDEPPIPSSSSITTTITRANLREAVTDNPCSICLEPFKAGDDVVVCSNNHGGRMPHIFHQACSLDYIVTHPEGINAPCPCCRNVLLPSEEEQRKRGCFRHTHQSALTLPDLGAVRE